MIEYYLKALKNYVGFDRRSRRSEFWYFALINVAIYVGLNLIGGMVNITFLGGIYYLAVLLPSIAVAIRRMHDVGKSGWFILIPIYNIILFATPGVQGDNEYGADPKAAA